MSHTSSTSPANHVTHIINESCPSRQRFLLHVSVSHVTCINRSHLRYSIAQISEKSCPTKSSTCHVPHINESCPCVSESRCMCPQVLLQISGKSCPTHHQRVMSHTSTSPVPCVSESCCTYHRVLLQISEDSCPTHHQQVMYHTSSTSHVPHIINESCATHQWVLSHVSVSPVAHMCWLRLIGSLKSQVSFAEYRLFHTALLQKRPII